MNVTDRSSEPDAAFRTRVAELDPTEGALLRLADALEFVDILKAEDGENGSLIDKTLPACIAAVRAVCALADDLVKPDPWMQGDDYGEGYTDGKSAAARLVRAAITTALTEPSR